ncbi:glycosyltransferase family 2 protein [Mucilaginibacter antarcticus]|uniref:Glycosyltransferase family 2 protein n=1 Tax=Mucilaginibacter antarcticus TaxID=1855725 RepID=A0ABW5XQG7_9SPHI
MTQALVSIIIPTFNYAHVLPDAIDCLLIQTYTNWEAIIVDDGSIDNTAEVVTRYAAKDTRIKFFYKANGGLSSARNFGLNKCSGDYIQFLDADDLISPQKIQLQIEYLTMHTEVGVSYTNADYFVHGAYDVKYKDIFKGQANWILNLNCKKFELLNKLIDKNIMPVSSALIKKSVMTAENVFAEDLKSLEDWNFWLDLAFNNVQFSYLANDDAYTSIRIHKISMSQNRSKMLQYDLIVRHTIAQKLTRAAVSNDELNALKALNLKNIAALSIYNGQFRTGIIQYVNLPNFKIVGLAKELLRYIKYRYIGTL